ncbi:MAG TPA: alpha/beta fold hydrolase [Deltaproteobacteria bacterium]|nr:alpha/beta fold hydrolase [Deltaproteobacteria bacterium]
MAYLSSLLKPRRSYSALRDQLGSVRRVYLSGEQIQRHDDMAQRDEIVLLLHGFFQTRNIWEVMEDRLRHDGYGVMSFNLAGLLRRFNTQPIDTSAQLVADKIEGLAQRHGFARVHVVGHSKGGLIARRYIQHYGGDRRVKSLITLGTPHHGTPTALLGMALMGFGTLTSSARELLPGSRMITTLRRDMFPAHIPLTSIYSREDLVCPYWSSRLLPRPGEHGHMENVEVRGRGHSELVWNGAVYRLVRDRLASAAQLWRERTAR